MFRKNFYFFIRSKPFLTALLVLTIGVIFSVVFTAYGTIRSLSLFYANPQNVRYCVIPRQVVLSGDIDCDFNIDGVREQIFTISTANSKSSTALVGVWGRDQWIPENDIDLIIGDDDNLNDLSAKSKVAWLCADYYNPHEHIDPWIEEITINNSDYAVAGMANYYFSEETWNQFVTVSEAFPLQADIGIPPSVDAFGNVFLFPDMAGTVLISGADLSAMDTPISFISVVFEKPPTKAQYDEMKSHFDSAIFDVDEYRSGSPAFDLAHVNGAVCGVAVLLALSLVCGLVRFFWTPNRKCGADSTSSAAQSCVCCFIWKVF